MFEIRFHGRGGQGAVVASKILALAFFYDGYYVQSFPVFGLERRGAPVAAFLRVDKQPIRLRTNVYHPDSVIVLDETLIRFENVADGLKENGDILINTRKNPSEIDSFNGYRVFTVNATDIALKYCLGNISSPIVNTAILGAYLRINRKTKFTSLERALREEVKINTKDNLLAAREAYRKCNMLMSENNSEKKTAK
ncbi:MAG: 2-oxoacid:acceptor oxidoreductase family protein [Candidatus Schekmanbacteria bacterium]|nr:2-oxoacid:acceptor oxidoreductase family protein [Candidatus Schekmanbacteria bacterium]